MMTGQWRAPRLRYLARPICCWSLVTGHSPLLAASEQPSLFRGVVVADSPVGVRVVSVEESSQAYLADLRPDDVIVQVQGRELRSIDEFATLSQAFKGRATVATVLVFRNGFPRELTLHLYSFPVLRAWGIQFVPDHDVRFADARIGLDYWRRLGRGFEEAGKPQEALDAYLNGLHNVPTDVATALKVTELFSRESHAHLSGGRLAEGIASLQRALTMMEQLFDEPLTEEQLRTIKRQLDDTLRSLRQLPRPPRAVLGIVYLTQSAAKPELDDSAETCVRLRL
jgi:hypothetical protein